MTTSRDSVVHHGTGPVSIGNTGSQTFGAGSPITAPSPATAAGRDTDPQDADAAMPGSPRTAPDPEPDISRNVFVVHGRDLQATEAMFELLRTLDLVPLDWERLVAATGQTAPYIGDVIHRAPTLARAALVLSTPDDVVTLHPNLHGPDEPEHERRPAGQPRPNVLIELGMVLMAYAERTVIVEVGTLRPISDIAGRNVVRFDGSKLAARKITERLKVAGCRVDADGLWRLREEAFQDWDAYHRRPEEG